MKNHQDGAFLSPTSRVFLMTVLLTLTRNSASVHCLIRGCFGTV
jgi:hypothetical protein